MLAASGGSGYVCAYHGKWHLGDEIFAQHGFPEFRSIEDGYERNGEAARIYALHLRSNPT